MTPADLLAARHELGMTQARLAAALGVQPLAVLRWEKGQRAIPPYLSLALTTLRRNVMTTTARTIHFNGSHAALIRNEKTGGTELWVRDEFLAGRSDIPSTYTLNDDNTSIPIGPDDDLDALTEEWKRSVGYDDPEQAGIVTA